MFPPALHPGGGYGPNSAGPINFHPLRLEDLTGAGGGQHQELQGQGRDTPGAGQLPQEGRHLRMGHGGVVGDVLYSGGLRQQLVQMAAPASWVPRIAIVVRGGEVQDIFDAALHTLGRFRSWCSRSTTGSGAYPRSRWRPRVWRRSRAGHTSSAFGPIAAYAWHSANCADGLGCTVRRRS